MFRPSYGSDKLHRKPYSNRIAAIPKRPLHACPVHNLVLPMQNQPIPCQVVYKSLTPRKAKVIGVKRLPKQAKSGFTGRKVHQSKVTSPSEQNIGEEGSFPSRSQMEIKNSNPLSIVVISISVAASLLLHRRILILSPVLV